MPAKVVYVRGIKVDLYEKSFRINDGAIGSEIVFPPTIGESTMVSLVTAIYEAIEAKAIAAAKEKVATNFYQSIKDML